MAANKRKQDEKHLKMLREMVSLVHNKQCLDCHQRGPTYINMTIGSFVCTSCSGILRGLNPPHRVKSISMTSFTPEEMEFLKSRGNDFCRKVWLGLYDSRSHIEPDSKDENKIKDFMSQKYEKKRWYVAPTEAMHEEARKQNVSTKQPETKPLRSLGNHIPALSMHNNQSPNQALKSVVAPPGTQQPIQRPTPSQTLTHSTLQSPPSAQPAEQKSSGMDLLGDLFGNPPASAPAQNTAPPGGGFADFNNFGNTPAAVSQASFPVASTPTGGGGLLQPYQPGGQGTGTGTPNTASPGFGSFPSSVPTNTSTESSNTGGDKYAALADLDSVFGSGGVPTPNPFGGGVTQAPSSTIGNPFMATSGSGSASQTSANAFAHMGTPSTMPGNSPGFAQFSSSSTTPTMTVAAGAQFGQLQNGGFGSSPQQGSWAFAGQPQSHQLGAFSGAAPQQQGLAYGTSSMATAQMPKMATSFGQPPQQQQFGGWGPQAASAGNPFMSATGQPQAIPPRSGSTNPFL